MAGKKGAYCCWEKGAYCALEKVAFRRQENGCLLCLGKGGPSSLGEGCLGEGGLSSLGVEGPIVPGRRWPIVSKRSGHIVPGRRRPIVPR